MKSMKKYIFLLVFFTHLLVAEAQVATYSWKGSTNDSWSEPANWIRSSGATSPLPDANSAVIIQKLSVTTPNYPKLVENSNAKTIVIQEGASLDIAGFFITDTSLSVCKIVNYGDLKLTGTNVQKTWFEQSGKIELKEKSTVTYNAGSSDEIWKGPYKNLTLFRDVRANELIVDKNTIIKNPITITSEKQQYKDGVKAFGNVTFKTNSNNGTINFESVLVAVSYNNITITKGIVSVKKKIKANKLDVAGKSFVAEQDIELTDNFEGKAQKIETRGSINAKNINIASSCDEWISNNLTVTEDISQNGKKWKCNAIVQAKNINAGLTCTNWTSTNDVIVEENIIVNDATVWKANSGNISFKKNLIASQLEQGTGKVIANGVGTQSIKAKKIKELEIAQTSISTLAGLNPTAQTIEKLNNLGIFTILANTNLTITELNNSANATLTSNTTTLTLTSHINNAGIVNISKLKLLPTGNAIKIEGNSVANHTSIASLSFELAGGKTFQIKNKIAVVAELKLSGTSNANLLNVEGEGAISVSTSLTGEGDFLAVRTNIPIENGTYKTIRSKPEGSLADIQLSKPENWIFNRSLYNPLTWKGGLLSFEKDWKKSENWIPRGVPHEESDVIIPNGNTHYPVLTTDVNAKSVTIQTNASVDLGIHQIVGVGNVQSIIDNSGKLSLSGTNVQRTWFEANKITLREGCTVSYYGGANANIYVGPYENLMLSRTINADSLKVNKVTTIDQAISIVAENQTYKGDVSILQNVTFEGTGSLKAEKISSPARDITFKCKNVVIKGEVTANKIEITNTPANNTFVFENDVMVTTSFISAAAMFTTKARLEAHDISISGTKWKSLGDVIAENDIVANSIDWEATGGDIRVKHDLLAVKLVQSAGKTILNGNTPQDVKLKKVKELIINSGAKAEITNTLSEDAEIEILENDGIMTIPDSSKVKIKRLKNNSGATFDVSGIVEDVEKIENEGTITSLSAAAIAKLNNVAFIKNIASAKIEKLKEIKLSSRIENDGEFSCDKLALNTTLDNITIQGNSDAGKTKIKYFFFEGAGGKTLKIKNKITVSDGLKLSGNSNASLLNVEGEGAISVLPSLTGEGEFLAVKTNIPIENGTYKTIRSKPEGSLADIQLSKPENWIFNQTLYTPLTWKGGLSSFEKNWQKSENWIPRGVPHEESDVVIPSGKVYYPLLASNVNARSVAIQQGASIDLGVFQILTTSAKTAKISNSGTLSLSGTNDQRAWFEAGNINNKIILQPNSKVWYYAGSMDAIYEGPYKNLKISRSAVASSLTVENITSIDQAISITADAQLYKERVEVLEDVTFATTSANSTIKFEGEVFAKNGAIHKNITITKGAVSAKERITANKLDVAGKSFVAEKEIELAFNFEGKSENIETKAQVKAKNINIATPCIEWVSANNVIVEESISVDDGTDWKANSGNVLFKKDLTSSKLQQLAGKIVANGTGVQNIKAKQIKALEVVQTSNSSLLSLIPIPQTIEKITNLGTLDVPTNADLTIAELGNKPAATFTSTSSIKLEKEITNEGMLTISTLLPVGNAIKIEGSSNQNATNINNLLFENAGEKSIEIKNNISVSGHLKLSGANATQVLEVKGPGKIYLSSAFSDTGRFLHVHTNIPLEGATCITEKSKPIGTPSEIQLGKPENWLFDDALMVLTWEGVMNDSWGERQNWRPKGLPFAETETIIPSGKAHYPLLSADVNAKSVAIENGALLDLSTFLIRTLSSKFSKISNFAMLKLEGTNEQKAWFESNNEDNKIILQDGCVVLYYGSSTAPIYSGHYKNLKLSRSVSSSSLTVENTTTIEQAITIDIDSQLYKGRVEALEDAIFTTTATNGTIKFEGELLAKNGATHKNTTITKGAVSAKEKITANKLDVAGKSFVAEKEIELADNFEGKSEKIETKGLLKAKNINIASSCNEWVSKDINITENIIQDGKIWKSNGVVQAKNINIGTTCTKWASSNDITVLENITAATTQWNATNGNISVFKDCNSPKLEQSQGALILNGNAEQNLIAKTLNRLEMQNTSNTDKMKLDFETVAEFILQRGYASLLKDIAITRAFANNGGVFDALENKKIVTLKPIDTLTISGKLSISGDPTPSSVDTGTKFYQLHCKNAGGNTLHFTNAIEILYDISDESDYVPQPNEGFTQDEKSLVLEGTNATSKLNIKGNAQIWFDGTPPYPKPKKGGKFLHVASGVQIRGGCYRVSGSTHDRPAPRNWIFEEYAKMISTLAINGTNEVCITFSRKLTKPVPDSLKITIPSHPDMISISATSYPKGSNKTESDTWFFQFAQDFTPTMLLEKQAVISLGESSLDFIFEEPDSDLYPFKKGYISDIGLNLVNPVLAKNTKQLKVFDGSKTIPFINTSLFVDVPSVLDGRTLKLYADSNSNFNNKYWVPNKANIPWKPAFAATQAENTGAAGFSIDVGKSTPDTKMFILPTNIPQFKVNETVGFMLSYEDLPCARLKDKNDIFSFDLWRFGFAGTTLQRAGVTVLNNVINVSRNQQMGIEITTKGAGMLTVQIMTLDGNIVKTFVNDYKAQGNYSFYWDGRNEAGRAVARGMYFVRVSGKGIDEIRKVLVTHD